MSRKKNILIGVGVLAAFLLGAVGGVIVGGLRGFRLARAQILNQVISKDARAAQGKVAALKQLRGGKRDRDKGLEALELALNDSLIMFDPAEPYPDLEPGVTGEIEKAIEDAMAYRKRYPRRKSKDMRDDMVKALFAKRAKS